MALYRTKHLCIQIRNELFEQAFIINMDLSLIFLSISSLNALFWPPLILMVVDSSWSSGCQEWRIKRRWLFNNDTGFGLEKLLRKTFQINIYAEEQPFQPHLRNCWYPQISTTLQTDDVLSQPKAVSVHNPHLVPVVPGIAEMQGVVQWLPRGSYSLQFLKQQDTTNT